MLFRSAPCLRLACFVPAICLALLLPLRVAAADLTLYSDRHQVEDQKILAQFTRETGIDVELIEMDADPLRERIKAEAKAPVADLVLSVGAASLYRYAQDGLLQPLVSDAALQAVPANLRDPKGLWLGVVYWARVIAYRQDRFQPDDFGTYEDLADPKFQGQVLVRSASSPYNNALVASMIDANGIEAAETWSKGLVANFARPPQGGDSNQLQAMAEDQGSVAIINTRYWGRYAASDKVTEREIVGNIGLVFPNQADRGTQVDITGIGILRGARHAGHATKFVEFLLRPDVQQVFAAANFEYPIRPGIAAAPVLQQLGPFKIDAMAVGKLGKFAPEAAQAMARAGWD